MKLWIDDMRDPPDDTWTIARKVQSAIFAIATFLPIEISIDHDIENRPDDETFKSVAYFIGVMHNVYRPGAEWMPKITIHSDNPVGAKEISLILADYGLTAPWRPYTTQADFEKKYGL